jgi:hypothetical protein
LIATECFEAKDYLDNDRWAPVWPIELEVKPIEGDTVGITKEPTPPRACADVHPSIPWRKNVKRNIIEDQHIDERRWV